MSKGQWKELLPCKVCYKIVKNAHQLSLHDRMEIELFKENVELEEGIEIVPFHKLVLSLDCMIRPGAQQHRMIKPLLAEKSLNRCQQILEQNRITYYKNLWFTRQSNKIKSLNDEFLNNNVQWRRDKKKEFKQFYANLTDQSTHHDKGCYVDFYLSDNDKHGLIAKINRKMKLRFLTDANKNRAYLDDSITEANGMIQEIQVNHFIVSVYANDKLLLKVNGNVRVINKKDNVSLEQLTDQGFEYPFIAGNYV